MSRYGFLLSIFFLFVFHLNGMQKQNYLKSYLQEIGEEVSEKRTQSSSHKTQTFFDQMRSTAASQSELFATTAQLETNRDLLNLMDQNKEIIQRASVEEQVVISNIVQHPFFSESDQDAVMGEILVQIATGVFKGMANKGRKLSSWQGIKGFFWENVASVANIIDGVGEGVSYLFLTPEQKKLKRESFSKSIESIKKACADTPSDVYFEGLGELIVDTLVLYGVTRSLGKGARTLGDVFNLRKATKVGRRMVKTGDMVEGLHKKRPRPILNADNLPLDQLPSFNKKLKGLPTDKQQLKALLIEKNKISITQLEEVIVGKVAESQGAIAGPITRPPEVKGPTSSIDFYTAGKKVEAIDVKSFRAAHDKPHIFDFELNINKIKKELAKGEVLLLNMAHIKRDHLVAFMKDIVKEVGAVDRQQNIIIALSDKNIKGLAAKGFALEK